MSEIITLLFSAFLMSVICCMTVSQYNFELDSSNDGGENVDIIVVKDEPDHKKEDEEYEPPTYSEIEK